MLVLLLFLSNDSPYLDLLEFRYIYSSQYSYASFFIFSFSNFHPFQVKVASAKQVIASALQCQTIRLRFWQSLKLRWKKSSLSLSLSLSSILSSHSLQWRPKSYFPIVYSFLLFSCIQLQFQFLSSPQSFTFSLSFECQNFTMAKEETQNMLQFKCSVHSIFNTSHKSFCLSIFSSQKDTIVKILLHLKMGKREGLFWDY